MKKKGARKMRAPFVLKTIGGVTACRRIRP
jgi:hypothetical protein